MKDFEVHSIGTSTELRLSRALASTIEEVLQQYGEVVPLNVLKAYTELSNFYKKQIEVEQ